MNQDPDDTATEGQSFGAAKHESRLESMLRKEGADEAFIAQRLMDMLEAKRKQWNTATKSFETFEDYKVQLAALEQIAHLLGFYPSKKELEDRHKPHETIIRVVTNNSVKKNPKHNLNKTNS